MVNLEQHHRRIRRKAMLLHCALIPLALAVPVIWIYMTYGVCQEAESPAMMTACHVFEIIPMMPAILGALVLAFIVWDLHALGAELHFEKHGTRSGEVKLRHAVRGYRAIDKNHKRHLHFAVIQVLLVASALSAWLICETRLTTR